LVIANWSPVRSADSKARFQFWPARQLPGRLVDEHLIAVGPAERVVLGLGVLWSRVETRP
jgi:hypothetical protein